MCESIRTDIAIGILYICDFRTVSDDLVPLGKLHILVGRMNQLVLQVLEEIDLGLQHNLALCGRLDVTLWFAEASESRQLRTPSPAVRKAGPCYHRSKCKGKPLLSFETRWLSANLRCRLRAYPQSLHNTKA